MAKAKELPPLDDQLRGFVEDAPETPGMLAKLSGVDEAVIRRFLGRKRDVTLATAARLASALGLQLIKAPRRR